MKHLAFGRLNVNNYTSPSAESEGSNDSIVFKPQLRGRGGLDGTRVSAGLQNLAMRGSETRCQCPTRAYYRMLDKILANPQTSGADSNFLMTDSKTLI
jgi:hypothetical protein